MQNFWWNRKFYHGKPQPDSFRLSRLEETDSATAETLTALANAQRATAETLTALTNAQTAADSLNTEQGKLLGEHTALLTTLTDIAAVLQEDVEQLALECDDIDVELTALEQNDNLLSARLDGMEEACADTAAEQTTRLDRLEETCAALPEQVAALESKLASAGGNAVGGHIPFSGNGCSCALEGAYVCSGVTLYSRDADAVHKFLPAEEEILLPLPFGGGMLSGAVGSIRVYEGELNILDLSRMPTLQKVEICWGNFQTVIMPQQPILTEVALRGNHGYGINLRNQTNLHSLILENCNTDLYLPDALPQLEWMELDYEKAQDEAFLNQYLADRSQTSPGYLVLSGATPPAWVAERNWTVLG